MTSRDEGRAMRALALGALLLLWPATGAAQSACAEGRVRGEAGRCCWPGQAFSSEAGRCEGVPRCPSGLLEHGDDCLAPRLDDGLASGPDDGLASGPGRSRAPGIDDGFDEAPEPRVTGASEDGALPPPPAVSFPVGHLPEGYGFTGREGEPPTTTAGWSDLNDLALADTGRRPIAEVGEDEGLISFSLFLFDVGWIFGLMVPMLDDLSANCRTVGGFTPTSCQSWPLAFIPVVGGIISGFASFGPVIRTNAVWAASMGSVSVILQVAGLVATIISFTNQTNEYSLELLETSTDVGSVALRMDAPGADVGASLELRF